MSTKAELYHDLLLEARGLFDGIRDPIANAANLSAVLWHGLPDLNWSGFYFTKGDALLLGPFQGKPACVRIAMGKGVCGTAAAKRQTIIVPDVHAFEGHIACDSASNSEIVIPLIKNGVVIGVLDLDSPIFSRFDEEDRAGLEALSEVFLAATDF
ncbi:GAF domain-containing protein [Rhizomicrobium palustre]|uniref:GAF domain-containing protein n=1 Tax=Rhizomicrobium palustre TaxID=189966 RepID=A0A846MY54_9PROT|nr:GAF domain-containing protein [Rhizomicrobium palustre]NIK88213.1 GAF domain-containing protein [Rhizomicrobium palustre]